VLRRGMWREFLRCQRCGLLAKNPMPPQAERIAWYREQYWEYFRDEQLGSSRDNVHTHALAWLHRLAPQPGTLVDVGCGSGHLLALCRKQGWKGIGFDPSRSAVAYAQAMGLEAYAEPWPPCPLANETAEAVTFINVLDHLRDPFSALQEAWRILRPGGLLYIRVLNGPVQSRLKRLLSAVRLDRLAVIHLFGFSRAAFQYHLPRFGFDIIAVRSAPPSQRYEYGQSGGWTSVLRSSLKMTDRLVYRVLAGLGLDRRAWGLTIEVMAKKGRPPTSGSHGGGD